MKIMKKTFRPLVLSLSIFALGFVSCVQGFDGTTADFSQQKDAYTGNYGVTSANGLRDYSVSLSASSGSVINAATNTLDVKVQFKCDFDLDEGSVENALTFFRLKSNSKNARYYPEHDGEISKTLLHVLESTSYSSTNYTFEYRLDMSAVTTNKIALLVDATKLRYKNGLAVLACDGNLLAGETTDSLVKYLTVSNSDSSLTSLVNSYSESYAAKWDVGLSDCTVLPDGKVRFNVRAPSSPSDEYDSSLSERLSQIFKIEVLKPSSSAWERASLSFTFHDAESTDLSDPYSANTYTADSAVLEQGTKWRVLRDYSVSLGAAPAWFEEAYGHPAFYDNRNLIDEVESGQIPYGSADTDFIFEWGGDTEFTGASDCTYNNAVNAQGQMLSVSTESGTNVKKIVPASGVVLDKTDGFVLVDSNGNIVESSKAVYHKADGNVDYVALSPKNTSYTGSLKVYVNGSTTIRENSYHASQLKFGCYPDSSKGNLSGYVELLPLLPGIPVCQVYTSYSTNVASGEYTYVPFLQADEEESMTYQFITNPGTYYYIYFVDSDTATSFSGIDDASVLLDAEFSVKKSDGTLITSGGSSYSASVSFRAVSEITTITVSKSYASDTGACAFRVYKSPY